MLPTGEIVNFGGKLIKNNQGFDLLQLMINSTGLLGVITKITFRLYPNSECHDRIIGEIVGGFLL